MHIINAIKALVVGENRPTFSDFVWLCSEAMDRCDAIVDKIDVEETDEVSIDTGDAVMLSIATSVLLDLIDAHDLSSRDRRLLKDEIAYAINDCLDEGHIGLLSSGDGVEAAKRLVTGLRRRGFDVIQYRGRRRLNPVLRDAAR